MYLVTELIKKKRLGKEHSKEELGFLVNGYTKEEIPDYQMAAWLMAVTLKGMTDQETQHLVNLMLHSGLVMDFSALPAPKVDKHSTGGVGDKTTLIIGPIVAACGLVMPTISGRGLGHTGGTLDKLESIPGFVSRLETSKFEKILKSEGLCFMGQTEEICPADRKIYSLRDVTSTIESLPLICASIMSKKLAEGINALVLDVKTGSGAFMKTEGDAVTLAQNLIRIGRNAGVKVSAVVSNMDEPLGTWIGNALEVKECLKILRVEPLTRQEEKTKELSVNLSAHLLKMAGISATLEEGIKKAEQALFDGSALRRFERVCRAQGGDLSALPNPRYKHDVLAPENGYVASYNVEEIGNAAILLKAGRRTVADRIDPASGIQMHKSLGDKVQKGEPLFTLFAESKLLFEDCEERLKNSFRIDAQSPAVKPLILRTLT